MQRYIDRLSQTNKKNGNVVITTDHPHFQSLNKHATRAAQFHARRKDRFGTPRALPRPILANPPPTLAPLFPTKGQQAARKASSSPPNTTVSSSHARTKHRLSHCWALTAISLGIIAFRHTHFDSSSQYLSPSLSNFSPRDHVVDHPP